MENDKIELSKSQYEILNLELSENVELSDISVLGTIQFLDASFSDSIVEKALNIIISEEQAMRLRIFSQDGKCFMKVQDYTYTKFQIEKKNNLAKHELESFIREQRLGVDIHYDSYPLYRICLYRTTEYVAVALYVHHLIFDGISATLFAIKLSNYCMMLYNGKEYIPTENVAFIRKIVSEHKQLAIRAEEDNVFWKKEVKDWNGASKIVPQKTFNNDSTGKRIVSSFDKYSSLVLTQYCESLNISPATVFEAAWIIYMLMENPDRDKFELGIMVTGRKTLSEKCALGNFAEELFNRVPATSDITIGQLYDNIGETMQNAYKHSSLLHDDVLNMICELHPETEVIRELEYGYIPYQEHDCPIYGSWFDYGEAETTVEFLVHEIKKSEFQIYFNYRISMLTEYEAKEIDYTVKRLVKWLIEQSTNTCICNAIITN